MFWIELLIVLVMIFIGTRKGGPFMALAGGIGMFILTFFLHVSPSDPPITVIRIMIAVILAASAMQAAGGLDYMVRLAEKILRKHPEHITILAPVIAYIFTFMCGTGHIVYSLLPVINEIAMDTGIRPERPISATVVASQNAITACPISAATAGILGLMVSYGNINLFNLLLVCVPVTLLGSVAAGISVLHRGKELSEDPEYLERVKQGLVKDYKQNKAEEKPVTGKAKTAVVIFLVAMLAIVTFGAVSALRPTLGAIANQYPWVYIVAVFIVAAITTSQASTTMIMVPIGMALNLPVYIIIAGWVACNANYVIPASGQCVAAIGFDSAGTTKIGKYVLNHSYMLPGLVMSVVTILAALALGMLVF